MVAGKRKKEKAAERQFARVVKGVDLRSTGGNSAWVRTPQLTCFAGAQQGLASEAKRTRRLQPRPATPTRLPTLQADNETAKRAGCHTLWPTIGVLLLNLAEAAAVAAK